MILQIVFNKESYDNKILNIRVDMYDYEGDTGMFYFERNGKYTYLPSYNIVYFGEPIFPTKYLVN